MMLENDLRDMFAKNIKLLNSDLELLKKEQFIPNELGTKGFIDLYAKDISGRHVLIELKRSNSAAREAIHEVYKYVEGVKEHFGVKDKEIHVIIASTEWKELLVPFSRFLDDATFSIEGLKIDIINGEFNEKALKIESISPLPVAQGRFIAPWHNVYWYKDAEALLTGVASIKSVYKEKGINDYVIVVLYIKNLLTAEESREYMQAKVAQMTGINVEEVTQFPDVPVNEYVAYVATQLLSEKRCIEILKKFDSFSEDDIEIMNEMDKEERLCFLHESVEAIEPRVNSDYYEIGYPAKFIQFIEASNCEIQSVYRNGSFFRNELLNDETILSEISGKDGSTGQTLKDSVCMSDIKQVKYLKKNISLCLDQNPVWKYHILRIIDEIQDEFPQSTIDISIFNPETGIFTLYYLLTKENGFLFLPSYNILVNNEEPIRMYYGALQKNGQALTFPEILEKHYVGGLAELLLSICWGGRAYDDSDIIESMGLAYRSFYCNINGEEKEFFALLDEKWKKSEYMDMFILINEYLQENEKLVKQIMRRIYPRDNGTSFNMSSPYVELDKLVENINNEERKYFTDPPLECDICGCSLSREKYMIDGETIRESCWAYMCAYCYQIYGAGIGWGKGQLYLNKDDKWELVGGMQSDSNN